MKLHVLWVGQLVLLLVCLSCGKRPSEENSNHQDSFTSPSKSETRFKEAKLFREAVEQNQLSALKELFKRSPDLNLNQFEIAPDGETPLTLSIKKGHVGIQNFLLENGADPEHANVNQETPLIAASLHNKLDTVKSLFKASPNLSLDDKDIQENTALHYAIMNRNSRLALLLIENEASLEVKTRDEKDAFHLALEYQLPEVQNAIKARKDVNKVAPTVEDFTMLLMKGDVGYIEFVLSRKPKLLKDSETYNPLVLLFEARDEKLIKKGIEILVKFKANVNGARDAQITPLIKAIQDKRIEIIKLLIKSGADVNLPDPDGNSPLMHAIAIYNPTVVELLLKNGAKARYKAVVEGARRRMNACNKARHVYWNLPQGVERDSVGWIMDLLGC